MKRSNALAPLSHDHHQGLVVAQRLRRATTDTAGEARADFLSFWDDDARGHFRVEEEILLPAFARHARADHEAIVRVLVDHVELRRRASDIGTDPASGVENLHELGERLHAHIRHEERILFPLIEAALPAAELAELVTAISAAEEAA